ncbi:MAG TPA: 16S rRNA (guanine(527)-N(7))-methyltransferase RsmG [Desulfotomaculum sp.]|nr:MAG: hypothetical protein VR67_04500 [Peptococcaceae bacterium BRH_c8a]KJS70970.1 MAG: hypothetical protein JL56_15885 [Desulfotomaculum sp. BICA1-6]HBX23900.1 16S rRNA (guanine(527)-N(7))-methyltransferase RsmG [Desulfotomaculum sp.]
METEFKEKLQILLAGAEIEMTRQMLQQSVRYYTLLVEENKKYNLTSITKPEEAAEKHFLDSLLLLPDLDEYKKPQVIDVGSGAGFPGLPLKIIRPELQMTLMDSAGKKTLFIDKIISELGLQGARTVHARAEEHALEYREYYDLALSRAVAEMRVLMELTIPLIKVGGKVIISKGPGVQEEIKTATNALQMLGGEVERVREFTLPVSGDKRAVVRIAKTHTTPPKYPRRPGMPGKRPL